MKGHNVVLSHIIIAMEIIAENICKRFGKKQVLDGFSHRFKSSVTTAVMGASGCGKSTLISILMGVLACDSGTVSPKVGEFKRSAVFQEDRLCENLTASANIRLVTGKRLTAAEISHELEAVGLGGCENKPVRELSGGMKRRVALLRALLAEYDVLFLDEPFKGLDAETKQTVMDYTRQKTAGRTVILVTHDKDECSALAAELITL